VDEHLSPSPSPVLVPIVPASPVLPPATRVSSPVLIYNAEEPETCKASGARKYKFSGANMLAIAQATNDKNPYLAGHGKKAKAWEEVRDPITKTTGRCKDVEPDSIRSKMEGMIIDHKVCSKICQVNHQSNRLTELGFKTKAQHCRCQEGYVGEYGHTTCGTHHECEQQERRSSAVE
jgi:hypothetical protein